MNSFQRPVIIKLVKLVPVSMETFTNVGKFFKTNIFRTKLFTKEKCLYLLHNLYSNTIVNIILEII